MTLTRGGRIQILKIHVSIFPDVGERSCRSPQQPTLTLSGHLQVESQSLFAVPLVTMAYVISLITVLLHLLRDFI